VLQSLASAPSLVKALNVETVPGTVERIIERVPGSPRTGGFYNVVSSADGSIVAATVIGPIELVGLPPIPSSPQQVILIDRVARTVELVSRTPSGGLQNSNPQVTEAEWLSISADGQRVSFVSGATNLDPAATATPRAYTYVYDRVTRLVRAIDLGPGIAPSAGMGHLDASGERIAYFCTSTPAQPAVPGEFGLCIRDLETFQAQRVFSGGVLTRPRAALRFSGDGQSIYFGYSGPGLIGGWQNPDNQFQAYLLNLQTQVLAQIPAPAPGQQGPTSGFDLYALPLSRDAEFLTVNRRVVRQSSGESRLLVLGAMGLQLSSAGTRTAFFWYDGLGLTTRELYVYDWVTQSYRFAGAPPGVTPNQRVCYSRGPVNGVQPMDMQQRIAISGDGRTLVFPSLASNLVPGDEPESCDLFARSLDPVPALLEAQPVPGPGPHAPALWLLAGLIALLGTLALRRSS
jgi:hypothetical protein